MWPAHTLLRAVDTDQGLHSEVCSGRNSQPDRNRHGPGITDAKRTAAVSNERTDSCSPEVPTIHDPPHRERAKAPKVNPGLVDLPRASLSPVTCRSSITRGPGGRSKMSSVLRHARRSLLDRSSTWYCTLLSRYLTRYSIDMLDLRCPR